MQSFQVSIGGASDDIAYDVADAGNGQFFTAGTTASFGAGGTDILITKMSATGSIVWANAYGAFGNETVRKISATPDSGLLVIGETTSFTYSQGEIFCMKVDAKGNLLWARHFGIGSQYGDLGLNIIQTTDGGYAFTGIFNEAGSIGHLAVGKLDANANIVWCKNLFGQQGSDGTGIVQDGNDLIVTTDLDHLGVNYTSLIMHYNILNGTIESQTQIVPASRGFFQPYLFKDINGNGYWMAGCTIDGYSWAAMQPTVLKFDNNFNITNTYSYKVPGVYTNDFYTGFAQMGNGFVACASSTASPTSGYLFYINNNGGITWGKQFSGHQDRSLYKVQHIGNRIITVGRDDGGGAANDFFVAGFSDGGYIDTLCHPDTSAVTITNPAFSESSFTWSTITDQTFANINGVITVTNVTLTPKSLCDACPVPLVNPSFTIPDTVCVNAPVKITNTTVGATSYYWSFCTADISQPPTGVNLGNIGNVLNTPVFSDIVTQNGNYYGFVTNFQTGELVKLAFGNSMLNTPTAVDLGSFGGILPYASTEGVQVVYSQTNQHWYAIVVGGSPIVNTNPKIVKIDFGSSLDNPSPVATDWGNLGNLNLPHDLFMFQDSSATWHGITINKENNTVTRFDFNGGFSNPPAAQNFGNIGGLNLPTGICAIDDNGFWRVFIINSYDEGAGSPDNGTITRLDFGSSLLNTPTAVNLGNVGNALHNPRDIYIVKYCGQSYGFVVNHLTNDIVRLDFGGNLGAVPSATSLGNIGNLNFPHSISKLFRVGADVYALIPNAASSTITRIKFAGCTGSSTPNSTAPNPPPVTYAAPGVYNVSLDIDDGLATQNSICQQVVVLGPPQVTVTTDTAVCKGDSINLTASGAASYQWGTATGALNAGGPSAEVQPATATTYYVSAKNAFGCSATDSVTINVLPKPSVVTLADTAICTGGTVQLTSTITNGSSISWSPTAGLSDSTILNPLASPTKTTQYTITASAGQCSTKDSVTVTVIPYPVITTIADTTIIICRNSTIQLVTTATNGSTYSWSPAAGLSDSTALSPYATPLTNTKYVLTVNPGKCASKDSVSISLKPSPSVTAFGDTAVCSGVSVNLSASASSGVTFTWSPSMGLSDSSVSNPVATALVSTVYFVQVEYTNNCTAKDSVTINVTPQPTITIIGDTSICSGVAVQLVTNSTNTTAYNWYPAVGLSGAAIASPLASPAVTTQYVVTANPGGKCTARDSVTITVNPTPFVKASGDTIICSGGAATLSIVAPAGVSYSWSPSAGLNDSTMADPIATPLSATTYFITVAYADGCTAKDSAIIGVAPQPTVVTIGDTAICNGTAVQLITSGTNATGYDWYPSTGLSGTSIASPLASPVATTQYIVTANPGGKCTAKDSVTITVNPTPSVIASADTLICTGGAARLLATASPGVVYTWYPANGLSDSTVANPVAAPSASLKYFVEVAFADGCTAKDSVTVTVNPAPVFAIQPTSASICAGDALTLTASGGDLYNWYPSTGLASPDGVSTSASPASTTTYQVFITSTTCKITDTLQSIITVAARPAITISKSNDIDCIVGQATLNAVGGYEYTWSPGQTLDNPYSASPVASPQQTTTYYVTVKNIAGCAATDSIQVKVLTNVQNNYYLASAFTPNGDGHNDCFGVKYWGGVRSIDFSVYNRWGATVFHTNNPSDCWDGTYKGQPQPPGTFVYQIGAVTICGPVYRKGTVVLIR